MPVKEVVLEINDVARGDNLRVEVCLIVAPLVNLERFIHPVRRDENSRDVSHGRRGRLHERLRAVAGRVHEAVKLADLIRASHDESKLRFVIIPLHNGVAAHGHFNVSRAGKRLQCALVNSAALHHLAHVLVHFAVERRVAGLREVANRLAVLLQRIANGNPVRIFHQVLGLPHERDALLLRVCRVGIRADAIRHLPRLVGHRAVIASHRREREAAAF